MKILIAADMEGITGVVHWDQVNPNHAEYARFRRLMTEDVNAAIRGAFDGGANEVIVTDGHNAGRNILIEELDSRARLNSGSPAPLSMVEGVDQGVDGVMFVGYHARIGTQNAILEHTWSDERVANLTLQGDPTGEIGLNAAVCGHFDTPVILISGDQSACAEAAELIPGIITVVTKQACGRFCAELLPPGISQQMIQSAAKQALESLRHGQSTRPHKLTSPIRMEIDLVHSEMADRAAVLPGASRAGRKISYTGSDMIEIYAAFRAVLGLARG